MARKQERRHYLIELRPESDCDEAEAIRGLRWILKRALRQYGLRCICLTKSEETHEEST